MPGKTVKPDGISGEIMREVQLYSQDVIDAVQETTEDVAERTIQKLSTSGGFKDGIKGKYRKSFVRCEYNEGLTRGQVVFAGKNQHGLTHLLEEGHLTRDGTTRSRAFPHWEPAGEWAAEEYYKRLQEKLEE